MKEYPLSLSSGADSKGVKPRGLPRNEPAQDISCVSSGPGLALGFKTFHMKTHVPLPFSYASVLQNTSIRKRREERDRREIGVEE